MSRIWTLLETHTQRYPEQIVLQSDTATFTYSRMIQCIREFAEGLSRAGTDHRQPVALIFQNTPDCVIAFLALARLGVHILLLGRGTRSEELHSFIQIAGISTLLGHASLLQQFQPQAKLLGLELLALEELQHPVEVPDAAHETMVGDDNHEAFIYHSTSGSTGMPRIVIQSQHSLLLGGEIYQSTYAITSRDTILAAVPFSHSFGLVAGLMTALQAGTKLLLIERLIPAQIVQLWEQEEVSIFIGTPFIYDLLIRGHATTRIELPPALRLLLSSGSPLPISLSEQFFSRSHRPIYEVYGSTETGVISAQWPGDQIWQPQSVGCHLKGISARIINEEGRNVPAGAIGQLLVQTPCICKGYLGPEGEIPLNLLDGYYQTGDLAWQNQHGELFLVGRYPLFIQIDGDTINPLEVEATLLTHPHVHEALVYNDNGLCAAIIADQPLLEAQLQVYCAERLARFQVPQTFTFVSELPRGELGKLRRIAVGLPNC